MNQELVNTEISIVAAAVLVDGYANASAARLKLHDGVWGVTQLHRNGEVNRKTHSPALMELLLSDKERWSYIVHRGDGPRLVNRAYGLYIVLVS